MSRAALMRERSRPPDADASDAWRQLILGEMRGRGTPDCTLGWLKGSNGINVGTKGYAWSAWDDPGKTGRGNSPHPTRGY